MCSKLTEWMGNNPAMAIMLGVVMASTILNKIIDYYGADHPKMKRALRFVIDLLAMLPMKGSPSRGVQMPMLGWSAKPEAEKPNEEPEDNSAGDTDTEPGPADEDAKEATPDA